MSKSLKLIELYKRPSDCTCDTQEHTPHLCPLVNNEDSLCRCCPACTNECLHDLNWLDNKE